MNLEEKLHRYKEINRKIEELEEEKKALVQSIMETMTEKTLQVGDYIVRRYSRLSITTPLEIAQGLRATKIEETVDKDAIKLLYNAGNPIEGVKEINYINVTLKNNRFV